MRAILVRHATCAPVGRVLTGRSEGVRLNDAGRAQAAAVAERLRHEALAAVYTSPLERTMETAAVIGEAAGVPVHVNEAFTEVDFGAWTGHEITALHDDPAWRHFNTYRSGTRIPGGELVLEVQLRAITALYALLHVHAEQSIAVVTHAELIRTVLGHCLGVPIDLQLRMEIEPASLSIVELRDWGARVVRVNEVVHGSADPHAHAAS